MAKEQIRAAVVRTIARIVSDEVLNNPERDISIREQMKPDSTDFLELILGLRKRHAVEVPEDDYRQLASSDRRIACLEPRGKGFRLKWV